jgi:MtN3 and saliva related transmembrane protein
MRGWGFSSRRHMACTGVGGMRDAIGWVSSVILVLTLGKQVYKQYASGTSEGISKWLFVGQLAASVGFTVYSALVGDFVFVVTNGLMVVNALAGLTIWWHHRRGDRRRAASPGEGPRQKDEARAGVRAASPSST